MVLTSLVSRYSRRLARPCCAAIWVALASAAFAADPSPRVRQLTTPPLDIYDRLPDLQLGAVPVLSDDERTLLTTAWERHDKSADAGPAASIDADLLLDAFVFASGVEKANAREDYRERFRKLATTIGDATKETQDKREIGERLMRLLHERAMHKRYHEDQTSFTDIFDSGRYNCVSSSAMYYLAGTSLGLELRPICIPGNQFVAGHASLDLVEGGERIQVEPTNPDGFDWQTKINRPGVIAVGLVPKRDKAHEVDGLGLAAMIYSNRGVALSKENPPRRLEALRCYLSALACDPADESAKNNLLAILTNWGQELTTDERFEDAVRVLGFATALAPGREPLGRSHVHTWSAYIEQSLAGGDDERALALVRRAHEATRHRNFEHSADHFIRHGDRCGRDDWEAALAVAERGLKWLPEGEHKALRRWRVSVFRQRSQALLESEPTPDVVGSLQVLGRAYALDPANDDLMAGIAYHTQEALAVLERGPGVKEMGKHFAALRREFPAVKEVAEVGRAHALRAVLKLADDGQFDAAIAAADLYAPLYASPEVRAEVGGAVYDRWTQHFADRREWEAALDKCAEGLRAYPKQDSILRRLRVTVDAWAKPSMDAKQWDEAIRIYDSGLERAPGDAHLELNRKYCERMREK